MKTTKRSQDGYYRMRPGRRRVLEELFLWEGEHKSSPTLEDLAERIGCTKQNVYQHLQRLVADGLVDKTCRPYLTSSAGRKFLQGAEN